MSGPPLGPEVTANDPRTAIELWKRRVAASPEAAAFRHHDGSGWRSTTFREADAAAREIAAGLVARGVLPGDRICLVSQTRMEWVLCDLAILLAGGVTVPIYASNTADQCEFIIRDAGAKIVIVNAQPTPFDEVADAVFDGSISEVLPAILGSGRRLPTQ